MNEPCESVLADGRPVVICRPCGLEWEVGETAPRCKPHKCDCGRRFYSRDRVTDCTNTGHKDKPL